MLKRVKRYANTPVLFISGHSDKIEHDEQKKETIDKADGYMQKPFKTKDFLETVRELLKE